MITIHGVAYLNRKPPKTSKLSSWIVPETENDKTLYSVPITACCASTDDFQKWYEENLKKDILLEKNLKLNGLIRFEDDMDPNLAGDIIFKNNVMLVQPVLPMF